MIAAHNGEAYIREALESVFAQSCLPAEILVVDDCSTDGTRDVVTAVARSSPVEVRLHPLATNSGGPAVPLNVGVAASRGDYVVLLDQDDRMATTKIELAKGLLERFPSAGIFFGQMRTMSDDGSLRERLQDRYSHYPAHVSCMTARDAFRDLIGKGFRYGGAGGIAIRKSTWEAVRSFRTDFRIAWDYDFAIRTVRAGWDVAYAPETVFYHRIHAGNLEVAEGGLRVTQEVSQLLIERLDDPSLSEGERELVRTAVGRALLGAGYGHRASGRYGASLRYYLLAIRKSRVLWPALVGLMKLSLSPARDALTRPRPSNGREAFQRSR